MKGTVSGDYPVSIIQQGINRLNAQGTDVTFSVKDGIKDSSFDVDLQATTAIVNLISTALKAVETAISILIKHKKQKDMKNQVEKEIHEASKTISKDFRITTEIKITSPKEVEIVTEVGSKIHLQSLEITANLSMAQEQVEVKIKPLIRGKC